LVKALDQALTKYRDRKVADIRREKMRTIPAVGQPSAILLKQQVKQKITEAREPSQ
jgi:hypothetical protein